MSAPNMVNSADAGRKALSVLTLNHPDSCRCVLCTAWRCLVYEREGVINGIRFFQGPTQRPSQFSFES